MIQTSEAIVIASQKYGDSSKIATFFTKDFGTIKAIAKGSFQIKSKYGSALEVLSYVNINFYSKPEGHLQLLSDAEIVRPYYNLSKSFEHITVGFALCETILKTLDEHYKNPLIFQNFAQSLNLLDNLPSNPSNILIKFLLDSARILGFGINLNNGQEKNKSNNLNKQKYILNLDIGDFKIIDNNVNFDAIDRELMNKIYKINILPIEQCLDVQLSFGEIRQVINILCKYYNYHLGKYFYLESMRLLA